MMNTKAISVRPVLAIMSVRDADVQRIAALVLSLLDRAGQPTAHLSRLVVYSQRLIVVQVSLSYHSALHLQLATRLQQRTQLVTRLVKNMDACVLIVDLSRSSLEADR